jgi:hypothetical protein
MRAMVRGQPHLQREFGRDGPGKDLNFQIFGRIRNWQAQRQLDFAIVKGFVPLKIDHERRSNDHCHKS